MNRFLLAGYWGFALMAGGLFSGALGETIPQWVADGKPVNPWSIPKEDYAYLASWLDEDGSSPEDYIVGLFARYQVVMLGEAHLVREHKDLVSDLMPRLYHEAGVRVLGWEFSRWTDNAKLESLVTSPQFDRQVALD
ncbi:MAG: hypothetical protein KJT03_20570, partial [Verrucomicrobiae bacterium]|nr:hypothetical protein [Verrucomicrobiae bacterium]